VHDLDLEALRAGEKSHKQVREELVGISGKARDQVVKDYIAWPLISGLAAGAVAAAGEALSQRRGGRRGGALERLRLRRRRSVGQAAGEVAKVALQRGGETYKATAKANFWSNIVRNFWSNAIIFCGHFPDQTYSFSQEEAEDESRGGWYVRQLCGAANIEGSPLFHVISGNLGYQVEHHLFPDMPSTRYAEIAPRVKEICERYGLPYNSGPFAQQWGMVQRTILRLAFPGGKPRPKPGPYKGTGASTNGASANGSGNGAAPAPAGPEGSGPEQTSEGVRVEMPKDR
jgi:linoleoyl-CoA desaturase